MKNILVSICCQSYNQEPYIRQCLEGFIIQKTNFPFEVLIYDDASTDKTADIIREYEGKYPDIIKPIYQTENQYSKKISIFKKFQHPRAKGKYIAICEGDDYWIDSLKLQKQVDFLEKKPDYGLVWTDIHQFYQESQRLEESVFKNDKFSFCTKFEDYLVHAPFRAPCTWLYRKDCARTDTVSYIVGDLPVLLDILAHYKIKKLDDVTAVYRVLDKSASHFKSKKEYYDFMKGIYKIQLDYANKYKVSEKLIETITANYYRDSYLFAIGFGDHDQVKKANKILFGRKDLPVKIKLIILIGMTRLGRFCLMKKLDYIHR